jgi:hypothetical protein
LTEYITKKGAEELEKQNKQIREVILAYAKILAYKDGRGAIDEVHIRKASKRVTFEQSDAIKWVLTISMLVLFGFAVFQMAIIYSSSQSYLWLLPIFSIAWVIIVTYIFKDFL